MLYFWLPSAHTFSSLTLSPCTAAHPSQGRTLILPFNMGKEHSKGQKR